jgi:PAS domain S-box-containing protein
MDNAPSTLSLSVSVQLLLTVFLVVLLWALHGRLRRLDFFRWWAWAWTSFAVYLGAAAISLRIGSAWTPLKMALIFILLVSGFLEPVLLAIGGWSWRRPGKPMRNWFWAGVIFSLGASFFFFAVGYAWRSQPVLSMAARNFPRTLLLMAALLFSTAIFLTYSGKNRSWAALITGIFCCSYAADQAVYTGTFFGLLARHFEFRFALSLQQLAGVESFFQSFPLFLDLINTCGICLGMILLLVENYQRTKQSLEDSELRSQGLEVDNVALQLEIEHRVLAQQALRESEERSRQLVQSSPVAMVVLQHGMKIELVNEKFTSLSGYTKEDVPDLDHWWPLAYPDEEYREKMKVQWQARVQKAFNKSDEEVPTEGRIRCKDGSSRYVQFHLAIIGDVYLTSIVDLTERKRAEDALRESEERYRDIVENSEDLLGTHELSGRILSINPAPARQLGYEVQELLQMTMQDMLAPRYRKRYDSFIAQLLEHGEVRGHMVVATRSGEERIWEYHSTLRSDGVSAPIVRGMAHDVTDKMRAEQALQVSEAKFASAFRASPGAMTLTRLRSGQFVDVNESFLKQLGFTREEVIGRSALELGIWTEADLQCVLDKVKRNRKVSSQEVRLRTKSGARITAVFSMEIIEVAGERLALAAGEDVSSRRMAEAALRESEVKFRLVAETVTCAIWILQNDRFVYLNPQTEVITGYSRGELLSMSVWDLVHPDFRSMVYARAQARLAGQSAASRYQFSILAKGGGERWLDFSASLTQFNDRPAVLATALDITPAKFAERELRDHAMYLDALISNSPLGIVIKDENNLVRFCNPAFERMFLYSQAEIQGRDLDAIIAAHDLPAACELTRDVKRGGVIHATAQRLRKDGTLLDVELHGVQVFSGANFIGAFAIYQDITERRRSEEKLQALRSRLTRAQEEERARIARDLHDDTGQRLALLSIELEQLKQSSMKVKSSLTQQLESLVKIASELTSDVHNVSRRLHPSQVELLGLPVALNSFCREFASRNGMEIDFRNEGMACKPQPAAALCLFRVAQEAIRNVQKHSGCPRAVVQLDEISGSLRLRVADQGAGFDCTSSEVTQGLGLLSMEERLHSLGGELFVHSRPGGGTCIEACIPIAPGVPA